MRSLSPFTTTHAAGLAPQVISSQRKAKASARRQPVHSMKTHSRSLSGLVSAVRIVSIWSGVMCLGRALRSRIISISGTRSNSPHLAARRKAALICRRSALTPAGVTP